MVLVGVRLYRRPLPDLAVERKLENQTNEEEWKKSVPNTRDLLNGLFPEFLRRI